MLQMHFCNSNDLIPPGSVDKAASSNWLHNRLHTALRTVASAAFQGKATVEPRYPKGTARPIGNSNADSKGLGPMRPHCDSHCSNNRKGLDAILPPTTHIDQAPKKAGCTVRIIGIAAVNPRPTQQTATCCCTTAAAQQNHNQTYCIPTKTTAGDFKGTLSVGRCIAPKHARSANTANTANTLPMARAIYRLVVSPCLIGEDGRNPPDYVRWSAGMSRCKLRSLACFRLAA
jgi:hypothetical protein